MQPDARLPTFYMWTFPPPYESLHGVLTSDHKNSASDTSGYMYETTRLHIPQESSLLSVRLEESHIFSWCGWRLKITSTPYNNLRRLLNGKFGGCRPVRILIMTAYHSGLGKGLGPPSKYEERYTHTWKILPSVRKKRHPPGKHCNIFWNCKFISALRRHEVCGDFI